MLWAANLLTVEFFVTVGLLVLVLLVGALVLHHTDKWRKRQALPPHESAESLSSFREMYENGEITESEYHALRDRVASRVKQEVAVSNPSTAASPADTPLPPTGGLGVDSADEATGDQAPPPDSPPK